MRDPLRVDAWLARIVRNAVIDEARKQRGAPRPLDAAELATIEERGIGCSCVLAQTERLKPEYAVILERVVVEGAAVADVARDLGLTANHAMVRLHRARKALKNRLLAHCGTTTVGTCIDCGCDERGCCLPP